MNKQHTYYHFANSYNKRHHLLQHSIYRLFTAESSGWLAQMLAKKSRIISSEQLELLHTDQTLPVKAYAVHHHNDDYFIQLSIIMLVDLRLENAAQQQMQLLESFMHNSPSCISAFDLNGRCILANAQWLSLLIIPQAVGLTYNQLLPSKEANEWQKNDALVLQKRHSLIFEESLVTPDHHKQLLSYRFPLVDKNNSIYAIACICNDITHQRLNEQKLNLTTKVFESTREGIMICDAEANIISVNHGFEVITGYSENEVLGRNPRFLSAGKTTISTYKTLWHDIMHMGFWQGELWNRRKNGESYPQQLSISVVRNSHSIITHYIGILADITARKQAEEQIHQLAFYDLLTGAANRYLLREQVEKLIDDEFHARTFTLLFLDLDHFKEINDVFGHDVGDQLLKIVSKRLSAHFSHNETICRLGGDEFVILLPDRFCAELENEIKDLLKLLIQPYVIHGHELTISASVGVSSFPQHGQTYSELLKFADLAMYHAKSSGRNAYFCFEHWMAENITKNVTLEMALRQAIQNNELHLVFQPQVVAIDKTLIGFEVLTRWNHPTLGVISPEVFIPIAEKSDFIIELTDWVLSQSLSALAELTLLGYTNLRIAVNISAREFKHQELLKRIEQQLALHPSIGAHQLELELTERMAMLEPDRILAILHALNQLGVRIAIDDFGTGYSSLSYLKKYPIDVLKIDKSFVDDIGMDSDDEAVCLSILALAKAMKLETIAEGVETEQQAEWLKNHGCTLCQGYLISRPITFKDLLVWLSHRSANPVDKLSLAHWA